ncbi:MAG: hypothetical protein ACSLFO_11795 [Acidimicrobiales bacterium]
MELDAATFCLQWATGGLFFLWVTTRGRQVGIGYGWLMRASFAAIAAIGVFVGFRYDDALARELAGVGVVVAAAVALAVSVVRRRAGVAGERERIAVKSARISEMTGIERDIDGPRDDVAEFPPVLDLVAPIIGLLGLVAAASVAGGPFALSLLRIVAGAAFLGAVTDAMLLGHWYLVQPGLARGPLLELVRWTGLLWPIEVIAMLIPTGMLSVLSGSIDDGYGGLLGWFWVACAITTIGLVFVTRAALKERYYSAVMAATGLLYLAILTGFGMDLVARAVLS